MRHLLTVSLQNVFFQTGQLACRSYPSDAPARRDVPFRVVVVDTSGELAPVEIAVSVGRDKDVSHLLAAVRARCAIPPKEKLLLAAVEFSPHDQARTKHFHSTNGGAKITELYTCAGGDGGAAFFAKKHGAGPAAKARGKNKFEKAPVKDALGFIREYPEGEGFPRARAQPGVSKVQGPNDLLVAYRMRGADTDDLVVVYPAFHKDWVKVKADAQEAKKRKKEAKKAHAALKERMKEERRVYQAMGGAHDGDDSDSYDDMDYEGYYDDDAEKPFDDSALNNMTWIKPCSIPLILPAHTGLKGGTTVGLYKLNPVDP
jgi:hypothetical protein